MNKNACFFEETTVLLRPFARWLAMDTRSNHLSFWKIYRKDDRGVVIPSS